MFVGSVVPTLRTDSGMFRHWKGALSAMALIALGQPMSDGDAPIKDKTIPIPKRICFGYFPEIA